MGHGVETEYSVRKGQTPTSSEKLLRMIRGTGLGAAASRDEAAVRAVSSDTPRGGATGGLRFFGARNVVGVDIGRRGIAVAAIRRRDGDFEVLALEHAALDASVAQDSDEFSRILDSVVSRACLNIPHPEIWCTISSSQSDMRLLGVPRVPASQRDNAVFWTARKELSFDEKTVIFDFEDRGEMVEKGAVKSAVFVHTIPRDAVTRRRTAFERAGCALAGMTLGAFADQNVFRSGCLPPPPGGAATLHVGENWSRLEIFRDGNLVFTRGIKSAMTALAGAVLEGLAERRQPDVPMAAPIPAAPRPERAAAPEIALDLGGPDEVVLDLDGGGPLSSPDGPTLLTLETPGVLTRPEPAAVPAPGHGPEAAPDDAPGGPDIPAAPDAGVSDDEARAVLMSLVDGAPEAAPGRPGHGLTRDEILDMADPALARLARQVEMTLKHYRETLGNDPVGALYVSGPMAASPAFLEYLEGHLGIPCEPFDPLGASAIRRPGQGPDPSAMSLSARCVYQQALGVALSRERMTPNLFVTYKERREARRVRMVNRATVAGFCLVALLAAGFGLFETLRNQSRAAELAGLREQMAAQSVVVDSALITRMADEAKKAQEATRQFARRNLGLGTISEVTAMTPPEIRLLSLSVDLGPPEKEPDPAKVGAAAKAAPGAKTPPRYIKKIILDGVVGGDSQFFESILAGYLVNLQNSPLFEGSTVSKRDVETMGGAQVLHFVVSLALAGK